MAVYTRLGAEALAQIIEAFDVGTLVSAKGIAEGVSNSNWLIETSHHQAARRFILTMYEDRVATHDLPFFLGLLDHLAARGCAVPRTIHDRDGCGFRYHEGKALALIEFLPGVSVSAPTAGQARAVGAALAKLHHAAQDFAMVRPNDMGPARWRQLADACGHDGLAAIDPSLPSIVEDELAWLAGAWPDDLAVSVIHADLFPDNVLMLGENVTGLIDFYFACNDVTAYDIAVTHAAWTFAEDGRGFDRDISRALLAGYEAVRPIARAERDALPVLARGAAIRFVMTRAYDWLNTPEDALVTRKDPMAFVRRLQFYADPSNRGLFAT